MNFFLKADGTCNRCSSKAHIGNRGDVQKIEFRPKSRQLQQKAYDMSKCFCPLGSAVTTEPMSRATLMRLFQDELKRINSPIVAVVSMTDSQEKWLGPQRRLGDHSKKRGKTRRFQASSPPPPTDRILLSSIPNPPSKCPMVNLDFNNLNNPMARYYGQTATLKGGDYLYHMISSGRLTGLGYPFVLGRLRIYG